MVSPDRLTALPGFEAVPLPGATLLVCPAPSLGYAPDALLAAIMAETPWRQDRITLWGKTHDQPRLTAWYGDPGATYTYSRIALQPLPWTGTLHRLKARVEAVCTTPFNSALLNLYRNGIDSMGLHSDDERELGPAPVIASLSLGATRRMVFRARHGAEKLVLELTSGSLLLMAGNTQRLYRHEIPKQRRIAAPRINLTFRNIVR